jgi:hypothetical protein
MTIKEIKQQKTAHKLTIEKLEKIYPDVEMYILNYNEYISYKLKPIYQLEYDRFMKHYLGMLKAK